MRSISPTKGSLEGERQWVIMPVSVQACHSFVDGIHIGKFADGLRTYLDNQEAYLNTCRFAAGAIKQNLERDKTIKEK